MTRPVVTLLTDFGLQDTFVGQMKGVLIKHCPDVSAIDLTHSIPPQSITIGAIHLAAAWQSFPAGTVHLAVVDPGVGTERRPIAVGYCQHYFVLPDNGLITAVLAGNDPDLVVEIDPGDGEPGEISRTFHGRDVFAPAAGKLASGMAIEALGSQVASTEIVRLPLSKHVLGDDLIRGEVVLIDQFGNAISNIPGDALGRSESIDEVRCGSFSVGRVCGAYQDVEPGFPVALVSSMNTLELAVRDGSATGEFGLKPGMPVVVRRRW